MQTESAEPSPTSSSCEEIDDDIISLGDGVVMAPVHDDVRDDIICAIFNLPKCTVFYQDFSCALVSTIVYHGRMYPAGDQVCFYSNLFGKETKLLIPYTSITEVGKTSSMFSHGLRIQTALKEYSFTSFWGNNRDYCASIIEALRQSKAPGGVLPSPISTAAVSPQSPPSSAPLASPPSSSTAAAATSTRSTETMPAEKVATDDPTPFVDVAHDSFDISTDDFVDKFMGDEAIYGIGEANRRRGATEIECELWIESPDVPDRWTRIVSFVQPVDAPIGPKSTRTQTRFRVDDATYVIDTETRLQDIPYGDCFKVDDRFVLTKLSPTSCDLVIQLRVVFSKSTMWRGLIESRAKSECKQKSLDWIQLAKTSLTPEGLPPWPANAAKATMRLGSPRKKAKSVSKAPSMPSDASAKKPTAATDTKKMHAPPRVASTHVRLAAIGTILIFISFHASRSDSVGCDYLSRVLSPPHPRRTLGGACGAAADSRPARGTPQYRRR
ncbi:Aste57867_9933 [Aphanomyces stellatus]|uniref:Aste57867_9933 protein n=1 Tax=Aphanomyces stellatus TaxID=120398 RepID=A0A485KPF3_9STRA|nr:hypothetical protein As57867_009894 [Aphanomyces stellatus]VFT86811.1 Aste57867_9933 [Aphanomyces stellatus]